jgi:hypothetical protein
VTLTPVTGSSLAFSTWIAQPSGPIAFQRHIRAAGYLLVRLDWFSDSRSAGSWSLMRNSAAIRVPVVVIADIHAGQVPIFTIKATPCGEL